MYDLSYALVLLGIVVGLRLLQSCLARGRRETRPATRRTGAPSAGAASGLRAQATTRERTTMREPRIIIQQITAFFEARQAGYRLSADETAIEAWFTYPAARFLVTISVRDTATLCVVTQMPVVVPEDRRPAVAELIARINYGLLLGGFALDLSDGELHFRVTMPLADAELTQDQFDRLMGASLWSAQRYHKAVCRLLYGDDLSPAEAVAEVEMAG